jgi:hypothetical protein
MNPSPNPGRGGIERTNFDDSLQSVQPALPPDANIWGRFKVQGNSHSSPSTGRAVVVQFEFCRNLREKKDSSHALGMTTK